MAPKEEIRIGLREGRLPALHGPEQPPLAIDPTTGQEHRLIKREVYELVRGTLKPAWLGRRSGHG